jgi:hypothetical protein
MSEQAPAPQDTPPEASPETGTPGEQTAAEQAAIDYQKRYEDLHPEYTRVTQEAAQLRARQEQMEALLTSDDPDTRRQAAQALGYELPDEEDDQPDPSEALSRELAALKQRLDSRDQEAQQAQQLAQIEAHVEAQLGTLDGLDDEDRTWIVNTAVAMPPKDGMPDIKGAHDKFVAWEQARQKKWAATKKAHPFSPVGAEGTQQPDLGTTEGKTAYILGRMAAEET